MSAIGRTVSTGILVDDYDQLVDTTDILVDDPIWSGDNVLSLAAFNTAGQFGSFSGATLEAETITAEFNSHEMGHALCTELWPVVDGAAPQMELRWRATLGAEQRTSGLQPVNRVGFAQVRGRGGYHQFRMVHPAGAAWTRRHGINAKFRMAGRG